MRSAEPDLLLAITAAARRIVDVRRAAVPESVLDAEPVPLREPRRLARALQHGPQPRVIAECKRRSPSRGILRAEYDPAGLADVFERHGAAALSVLTEPAFFDGHPDHLRAARRSSSLPILRKDFIIDRYQVAEARAWGADAVLLIVAALGDVELRRLIVAAEDRGLDALVEVHDAGELARAVGAGATIIGVNSRNLRTFDVSLDGSAEIARAVPDSAIAVAESGMKSPSDLRRLATAGFDAFLVGEHLMTAPDPGRALAELRSC